MQEESAEKASWAERSGQERIEQGDAREKQRDAKGQAGRRPHGSRLGPGAARKCKHRELSPGGGTAGTLSVPVRSSASHRCALHRWGNAEQAEGKHLSRWA